MLLAGVEKSIFGAMKKLFFMGACLVALSSSSVRAQAAEAEPQVVVVRVADGTNGSQVIIVRGPGRSEQLDMITSTNTKGLISSGLTIQQAIAKLYQEGYSLKSTFSGYQGSVSTLVFVKEK
jgi:hypothetical protein